VIDKISVIVPSGQHLPDMENERSMQFNGSEVITGNWKNFRIKKLPDETVILSGSLAKFLNGENAVPLSRKSVALALDTFTNDTGFDLKRSRLIQAEVGTTLPVSHSPNMYLQLFGYIPRFNRRTHGTGRLETVEYCTTSRQFIVYDKRAEMKKHRMQMPTVFGSAHALRLELKYQKGVSKIFKRALAPYDLADSAVYQGLITNWQDFYFKIPKGRKAVLNTTGLLTSKDFFSALNVLALEHNGQERIYNMVSELQAERKITNENAKRIRDGLRGLSFDKGLPDDITAELDNLVRYAVINAH